MRNLRVTPVPPHEARTWYSPVKPCRHCPGKLCYRNERDGALFSITVQHQAKCPALKE